MCMSRHIHTYTYARSVEYTRYTSAGSLLPAVCGSAVSHTCRYSCVTNACIRPPRTSALARARAGDRDYTRAHRDGKCNQCTNLRRSPLERGRPALGTYVRTYMCSPLAASARARPSGAKPCKLVYLGRAFFEFRTTGTFRGIFSVYRVKFRVRTVAANGQL